MQSFNYLMALTVSKVEQKKGSLPTPFTVQATIAKHLNLDSSRVWNPQMKLPADSVSREDRLPGS